MSVPRPRALTVPRRPLAGLARTVRIGARTQWGGLLAVAVLQSGLVTATARGIEGLYPAQADRDQYAATVGLSKVNIIFNGRGYDLTSVGGIVAFEVGFMGLLLFPLTGLILAIRLTRRQEEAGRVELVSAGRVGVASPSAAATVLLLADAAVAGGLIACGLAATGPPADGAVWYALGVTGCTTFFGALGLLLAQLCQETRVAYRTGAGAVVLCYLLRAVVDGHDAATTWVGGPLGWLAEVRPFGQPRPWPLAAYGVGVLVLLTAATTVALRRDLGSGVLAPRPGPARARRGLATGLGLAWRLCRAAVVGWGLLAVVWSGLFGWMSREVADLVDANPTLLTAMGADKGSDLVVMMAAIMAASAAAGVGAQAATRLAGEETSGRLGAVVATQLGRTRLWCTWWLMAVASALAVLAAACLALGAGTWWSTGERGALTTACSVGAGYAVPVVFVVAACAALASAGPRWAGACWVLFGWCLTVGFLGEALRLPEWAENLSPLHLVGALPLDDPDGAALAGLAMAGVVLLAGSVLVFRGRDLRAG